MYKLYTDKQEIFECDIQLEGASLNKELTKKPQKFFSKSRVIFDREIDTPPTGEPLTREQARNNQGKQNIKSDF